MNQATFRGVALLLYAVACITLGGCNPTVIIGCNGNQLEDSPVTTPIEVTPSETLSSPNKLEQCNAPKIITPLTSAHEMSCPHMPPQKKSEKEKVKSHWFWEFGVWVLGGILSITGIATCFIKAFTKSFAQSLADYMLELLKISFKKIWTKTIRFFKHTTPKAKVKATRLSAVSPSQEGKVAPKNVLLQSAVNVIQNAFESDERLQFSCESLQGGSCFGTVRVNNPARNCVGIVRVQIEGQSSGGHKTPITRKILIADLEKYLKNGGAVFLLARFCPKNGCVSIFYKELLPLEINALLNSEPNSNAKKRQLTLSELQPESLADVFTHFLDNARRQRPFYNEKRPVVSMQDLLDKQSSGECKILVSAPCGNNYVDLALHPEACFYVEVDSVLTPVLYHLKTVGKKINASVSVDNQEYYNEITIERKRGALVVKFGSAFSLLCTPNANASSLHCELQRTPKDFIKDVRFFIAMQKASGFKIDERVYNIKRRRGWQAQIEELAREIEYFENVVKVFKIFKLNLNIHINKLSEIERQNINILIGAFVEGKHIRFNSPYPSAGPQDLQVGLEKVKLFFTATSKRDVFRVEDFFKFNGKFERTNPVTNETWETSPFVILTKDDLVNVVNIDFSILLPSFQQLQDPRVKSDANQLFLNLLSAYDECEKNNRTERAALLMEVADAFNDWLLWLDPTQPVERLNRLQIIKRKRPLTTEEEETAIKISEEENDKIFRFAACALLNERARAQKLWREFSQEEQKIVKSWPIARFVDDEKFPILLKEQETSLVPLGPAIPQETVPTPPAEPSV